MDTTQGEMLSRSSLQPFSASTNLQIARNHFIEVKLIKKLESVIPHQTMFQHQLGFAMHLT